MALKLLKHFKLSLNTQTPIPPPPQPQKIRKSLAKPTQETGEIPSVKVNLNNEKLYSSNERILKKMDKGRLSAGHKMQIYNKFLSSLFVIGPIDFA